MKVWPMLALAIAIGACSKEGGKAGGTTAAGGSAAASSSGNAVTGAGSSFAYPIYSKWAAMYADSTNVHVNYQSVGSGAGIKQLSEQIVDFGASDGPMTDDQLKAAKGGAILHFPTVLGGVSITYNLPQLQQPIRLTGPVLAEIYLGKITKWDDSRIVQLNPGVKLPSQDIVVTHRTDGSGTTYIFSDYLSAVSPQWASGPGKSQTINWPVGLGGKGSEGVSGLVKQTPGAIGYVELSYAKQNKLPSALIQNPGGEWVAPTLASVTAAAAGALANLPANTDYRISIVNAKGKGAYPISSFTWVLLYRKPKDAAKAKAVVDFFRWGYTKGESVASSLDYAPLPAALAQRLAARLDSLDVGGAK